MSEPEQEMRNRDTRGIVDHWLDRLVDVEGDVHKTLVGDEQDMVVTIIITGRCPSNLPPNVCESCGNAAPEPIVHMPDGTVWHVDCYFETFKGDEIWKGPSPLETPLDRMVRILVANDVEITVGKVRMMRQWLESALPEDPPTPVGFCMHKGKKHWREHIQRKSCIDWMEAEPWFPVAPADEWP